MTFASIAVEHPYQLGSLIGLFESHAQCYLNVYKLNIVTSEVL